MIQTFLQNMGETMVAVQRKTMQREIIKLQVMQEITGTLFP